MPTNCVDLELSSGKTIPLEYTATGGGWGGDVSIRGAIALVEVGTADIVNRSRGEVLWRILRPAKLLLGFTVDLDRIEHGDSSRVNRCSNFKIEQED